MFFFNEINIVYEHKCGWHKNDLYVCMKICNVYMNFRNVYIYKPIIIHEMLENDFENYKVPMFTYKL